MSKSFSGVSRGAAKEALKKEYATKRGQRKAKPSRVFHHLTKGFN